MTIYKCDLCRFSTLKKTDYSRHIETKKHCEKVEEDMKTNPKNQPKISVESHLENSNILYPCSSCGFKFTRLCNLRRHEKICIESKLKDKNNKIIQIEEKNENDIKLIQIQLEEAYKQIDIYKSLLHSSVGVSTSNTFNYISHNYVNTPKLEGKKTHNTILDAKTMTLIEVIKLNYDNETLAKFIGDYIIREYKKEPQKQSMWVSDVSRLTYIIREYVNRAIEWVYDKKGLKVKEIVIKPILDYINNEIKIFVNENSLAHEGSKFAQLSAAGDIMTSLRSGTLATDITKYIASHFTLENKIGSEITDDIQLKEITNQNDKGKEELYPDTESSKDSFKDQTDKLFDESLDTLDESSSEKITKQKSLKKKSIKTPKVANSKIKPIKQNTKTNPTKKKLGISGPGYIYKKRKDSSEDMESY